MSAGSDKAAQPIIIIKRVKKRGHGHHGGAWKVAYADFVTAMMAFFLVMWILGVGTDKQRAAISEYFQNPSMTAGTATVAPPGVMGPGGASSSLIDLGGGGISPTHQTSQNASAPTKKQIDEAARKQDHKRLEELKKQLNAAIQSSQALAPYKDQLLIDITPEGLRIQIVDKKKRPMFNTGSATLKGYTNNILHEMAKFINQVPNHISIAGHTDDAPYISDLGYSNWELSTDRANAARRALMAGGLSVGKVARIVGLADTVPVDKAHPDNPRNRRISILVMNQATEAAFSKSSNPATASSDTSATNAAPTAASAKPQVRPTTQANTTTKSAQSLGAGS